MSEDTNTKEKNTEQKAEEEQCQCEQKTEVKVVEENLDYKEAHARAVADYDNLKKQTERLRQEYARYAASEVVEQILPVLDNLKKALEQAPDQDDQWVNGIKLIREQFEKVLEAAGVQSLGQEGEEFDPNIHDALMREKREGIESDTVIQVVEPGYKMHDKIIRPAKVIVAE